MKFIIGLALLLSSVSLVAETNLKSQFRLKPQFKTFNQVKTEKRLNLAYRLQSKTMLSKRLSLNVGLATVGSHYRSIFVQPEKKSLSLRGDYINLSWRDLSGVSIRGGYVSRLMWLTSDFLLDSDIHLPGIIIDMPLKQDRSWSLKLGGAKLEQKERSDWSYGLWFIQPQFRRKVGKAALTASVAKVFFPEFQGSSQSYSSLTNSRYEGGIRYVFNPWIINQSLEWERLRLFNEWVINPNTVDNVGFSMGMAVGQFNLYYRQLQKDAWPDSLPDYSAMNGQTDMRGVEFIYTVALNDALRCHIDYYYLQPIIRSDNRYSLIQLKFDYTFKKVFGTEDKT